MDEWRQINSNVKDTLPRQGGLPVVHRIDPATPISRPGNRHPMPLHQDPCIGGGRLGAIAGLAPAARPQRWECGRPHSPCNHETRKRRPFAIWSVVSGASVCFPAIIFSTLLCQTSLSTFMADKSFSAKPSRSANFRLDGHHLPGLQIPAPSSKSRIL